MSTCNKCGWVHFDVTREHAEAEVARFNAFFDAAGFDTKINYIPWDEQQKPHEERNYSLGYSRIKSYEHCFRCGNTYKDFRDSKDGDCPDGCTIQPIIRRQD